MNGKRSFRAGLAVAAALALVCVSSLPALAANKLIVKGTDGTTDKMVVTDSGYIGIGTNAPSSEIQTVGLASESRIIMQSNETTAAGGGGFIGLHSNAGSTVDTILPRANDRLGYLFYGSKWGNNYYLGAGFAVNATANWTTTSTPTYFNFQTTPVGSIVRVERMRIDSDGNVGIGTTAPSQKLDVLGGIRLNSTGTQPTCNSTNRGTLWLVKGATDALQICVQSGGTPTWKTVTLQ